MSRSGTPTEPGFVVIWLAFSLSFCGSVMTVLLSPCCPPSFFYSVDGNWQAKHADLQASFLEFQDHSKEYEKELERQLNESCKREEDLQQELNKVSVSRSLQCNV